MINAVNPQRSRMERNTNSIINRIELIKGFIYFLKRKIRIKTIDIERGCGYYINLGKLGYKTFRGDIQIWHTNKTIKTTKERWDKEEETMWYSFKEKQINLVVELIDYKTCSNPIDMINKSSWHIIGFQGEKEINKCSWKEFKKIYLHYIKEFKFKFK